MEEWATTLHTPNLHKEALEPERDVSLGVVAITWRRLPLTPPGFSETLPTESGPPPLQDAGSQLGVPWGAQLDLTSLGSMQMVITQNTLTGDLQYHYETGVISQTPLHLTLPNYPDQHDTHLECEGP